jgi:hypothetical protein
MGLTMIFVPRVSIPLRGAKNTVQRIDIVYVFEVGKCVELHPLLLKTCAANRMMRTRGETTWRCWWKM